MHPLLFQLGPFPVHTYGFLIAVGFLIGLAVTRRLAIRSQLDVEKVLDLAFWGLLIGFLGSRILYIITRLDSFLQSPLDMFKVWEGGLVFLGGPIAVLPFLIFYTKKHKLPIWKTGDCLIPGLAIAHAFGRLGCLSAGCCYGKPTGTSFGVKLYSDLVEKSLQGIPLHPTQLYEAGGLLILFFGLISIFRKKVFDGQVILTYFLVYPILRSIIEVFRGDLIRGFVIEDVLSTSQFISIWVFLAAAVLLMYRFKSVSRAGGTRAIVKTKNA